MFNRKPKEAPPVARSQEERPKSAAEILDERQKQLALARENVKTAEAAERSAQDAFDEDGSPSSEKALFAARDSVRSAAEHVGRAERLVAAAEQAKLAEQRAEKEARLKRMSEELDAFRAQGAELEASEIQAWVALAEARLVRRGNSEKRKSLQAEHDRLKGHAVAPRHGTDPDPDNMIEIAKKLQTVAVPPNVSGVVAELISLFARYEHDRYASRWVLRS